MVDLMVARTVLSMASMTAVLMVSHSVALRVAWMALN